MKKDEIIFQRINSLRLSEAAEIISTFEQLEEFASQAGTIIQGPWTQELADAAKNLPTNGGTADIVAISKEVELQGGVIASGAYALGISEGEFVGLGAVTVIGVATALLMVLSSLGVGYDLEQFEADHELWHNILNNINDEVLKDVEGVTTVVTPDNKTYLPQSFVEAVKDSVYQVGYFDPYTITPIYTSVGQYTFDLTSANYPTKCEELITNIKSFLLDFHSSWHEKMNIFINKALDIFADEGYDLDSYYPLGADYSLSSWDEVEGTGWNRIHIYAVSGSQLSSLYDARFNIELSANGNLVCALGTRYHPITTFWASCTNIADDDPSVYQYGIRTSDTTGVNTPVTDLITGERLEITGLGNKSDDRPTGMKILPNSLLPNDDSIADIYPSWSDEAINVAKYNPQGAPIEEMPFIPIEVPRISGDTTESNQDDVQKGDIVTIPQEMPLVVGQRALQEIIDPTENPEAPDPLTEPIPEIHPESPAELPDSPVNPETTPQPEWIPDPPFEPVPPTDPEPGTEPAPQPVPVPQPIPTPPSPPAIPTDDGTSVIPVIPTIDPTNGIGCVYNPSRSELISLSQFLWSTNFIDQIKKLFQSPVDGIISLHQLYATPSTGSDSPIYCGYLDSGVTAPIVTNQFASISCGSVTVNPKYNNALDYSPHTKVSVYLPFIGIRDLDADDIIGSTVTIDYKVDVLNGACLASIKCARNTMSSVLYTFEGNCAIQLPVTGATFGGPQAGLMTAAAVTIGAAVATGGLGAAAIAAGATGMISGSKTSIQKSGNISGNAGALGSKIPYLIISRPIPAIPANYNLYYGMPASASVLISSLSGYARMKTVHADNIGKATNEEKAMIENILTKGFFA